MSTFGITVDKDGKAEMAGEAALGGNIAMVGHLLNALREPGIKVLLLTPQSKPLLLAALNLAAKDIMQAVEEARRLHEIGERAKQKTTMTTTNADSVSETWVAGGDAAASNHVRASDVRGPRSFGPEPSPPTTPKKRSSKRTKPA